MRFHGRKGRVYMGVADDVAVATPLPFIAAWSISFATDKQDVTAFGDSNKTYVAGLPDASGDFSGFLDDQTAQTYTAAVDGLPRKFYLYPNLNTPTVYWYGTIFPDFSANSGVSEAGQMSASWNAASAIQKAG